MKQLLCEILWLLVNCLAVVVSWKNNLFIHYEKGFRKRVQDKNAVPLYCDKKKKNIFLFRMKVDP